MKVQLIIISIILLLVVVFACGCIPVMEKLGLVNPTDEEQLSPEKGGPPDGLVKVLIGFKEKPGAAQQAMGGKIKYTYHIVDAIAASIPEKAIDALQKNPNIRYVEPDGQVYALDDELDDSWGVKRIGAGLVHDNDNKGYGVKIAIIDSGIDRSHGDLAVVGGKSFVSYTEDFDDDNGHGTHVAGIVAALDDGIGVVGVAPAASLYALKVLNEKGIGYFSDVILAVQWCADNGIQVTNNSYGSSGDPGDTLKSAFDISASAGVLHVAAAGNSGNPPGRGDNIIYPARYESVIAVAATDQSDKRARFSSTGPDVELAAPGVSIYSTYIGGYTTYSGTSMASPHVAGVAALVITSGTIDVLEVREKLQDTADDLGASGLDSLYGYGLIDAAEAADVSGGIPDPPPAGGTMHVDSIDMSSNEAAAGPNTFYTAIATVTIVDADGNLEGATVSGTWSGATNDTDSGITDINGQVSLESSKVKNPISGTTFTFIVDNVSKDGWTYDLLENVETSDSIEVP
jgi:subtilisin